MAFEFGVNINQLLENEAGLDMARPVVDDMMEDRREKRRLLEKQQKARLQADERRERRDYLSDLDDGTMTPKEKLNFIYKGVLPARFDEPANVVMGTLEP